MAKKDKKKKDKTGSDAAETVEAIRSAVERALPAGSKERGRELVDEVARAVTRVRQSLEERGVFDELRGLRGEIENLARRVTALEGSRGPASSSRSGTTRTTSRTPSAAKSTASRASRPAASRASSGTKSTSSRAKSTAAKKPAASRSRSTAAKSGASSTAAKKPAASRSRSTSSRSRSSS